MRKRIALVAGLTTAWMTLGLGASADNLGPCNGEGPGNSGYAEHHIAFMAQNGLIGSAHVPGTHQGFSLCLGVHTD